MNAPVRPTPALVATLVDEALAAAREAVGERSPRPLPSVSRDFGHDPLTLDRVAAEHSAALAERERRLRHMARPDGRQSALARALGYDENGD